MAFAPEVPYGQDYLTSARAPYGQVYLTSGGSTLTPFEKLRNWRKEYQVCSNLYCNGKDCKDCNDCGKKMCLTNAKKTYSLSNVILSKLPFERVRKSLWCFCSSN